MATTAEKVTDNISQTMHKVKHATSTLAGTIDDAVDTAKHIGKRSSDAAEELMDDTVLRIKRHPTETVVGAFVLGVIAGGLIDYVIRRR
ncbi:MAG: hypothetical protein ACR2IF_05850 [Terriglobales bacterium]